MGSVPLLGTGTVIWGGFFFQRSGGCHDCSQSLLENQAIQCIWCHASIEYNWKAHLQWPWGFGCRLALISFCIRGGKCTCFCKTVKKSGAEETHMNIND
eukprot:1037561-Amphidinium_carterae.1